jgi:outer membrane lipoprotein SlyB
MANGLKKHGTSRDELMRKFTLVEQAGNRILVSAAGGAGLGGAFGSGEGAAVGAVIGAVAGFFLGHHPGHRRQIPH